MDYLTNQDLDYFESQSQGKINLMIAGMTSLMSENDTKIESLEKQDWFQRMANTITGKNKMTLDEISANTAKINGYITEAISSLYDREKLNQDIMLSLGNKVNELYANQLDLKIMLGSFVNKLNQKIESIDNFHMLIEEINQKVYSSQHKITGVCMIGSQLDSRTVHDDRKMDILKRAMQEAGILTDEEEKFVDFLVELLNVQEANAGVITLFLDCMEDDYTCEITKKVLQSYFFLPEKIRKMKNKHSFVESILNENDIDNEYAISTREYFDVLFSQLVSKVIAIESENIEKTKEYIKNYFDTYMDLVSVLRYNIFYGDLTPSYELLTDKGRRDYYNYIVNMKEQLNENSFWGMSIRNDLKNITLFIQILLKRFPEILQQETYDEDGKTVLWKFKNGEAPIYSEYDNNKNKIRDIYMSGLTVFEKWYSDDIAFSEKNELLNWNYYKKIDECGFYEWIKQNYYTGIDYRGYFGKPVGGYSLINVYYEKLYKFNKAVFQFFESCDYSENIVTEIKNIADNYPMIYRRYDDEGERIEESYTAEDLEKLFKKPYEDDRAPYIEANLESNYNYGYKKTYCGGLCSKSNKVTLRFNNYFDVGKYSVSYEILENRASFFMADEEKCCSVRFGEWDWEEEEGRDTLDLIIDRISDLTIAKFDMKVYIKGNSKLENDPRNIVYIHLE